MPDNNPEIEEVEESKEPRTFFTTAEAAGILKYKSAKVVKDLINQGTIKADKLGRDWIITKEEILAQAIRRKLIPGA